MNVFLIVVGVLAIIGGIVLGSIVAHKSKYSSKKNKSPLAKIVAICGVVLILLGASFSIIPTGYTGVRTTFGQISDETVSNGFNWKIPFVQSIHQVNNKRQDWTFEDAIWGETSERTAVYGAQITVTYQIGAEKSAWIYANVSNTNNLITHEVVSSAFKAATVTFSASDVTKRDLIEPLTAEKLNESLKDKYGEGTVNVLKVVINDMDFEDSYNQAIAEKSIALQKQEQQAIENETAIAKAEADKRVKITNAEASAEATRIAAEAEANANNKIRESLTDGVLKSKFYDKWNGELPQAMGSDTVITNIANNTSEQ